MKTFYSIFLKITLALFVIIFLVSFFYFSRVDSLIIKADNSFYQIDKNKKAQKKMESHLEKYKGKFTWTISLKQIAEELQKIYPSKHVQVVRKLPNQILIVIEKDKPIAILMKGEGRFYSLSKGGGIGGQISQGQSLNFPVLRGKDFWKHENLRKQVLTLLTGLPKEGLMNFKNISEVKYKPKTKSFLFVLVSHNFIVETKKELHLSQAKNINFTLDYLAEKQMLGRHIDSRFEKKIIVNTIK